jgi:preprotein translocase SecE subunit
MKIYKEDQGRIVRLAAFWLCIFLLLYGCIALYTNLRTYYEVMKSPLVATTVPLFGTPITAALIVAVVLFGVGAWLIHMTLQKPRHADLMIETENELRKVTWPTMPDVVNTSVVVVLSVLILMGFLFSADVLISRVMQRLLLSP